MTDTPTKNPVATTGLKKNALGPAGVVFLVLAAASPLIGLTGAVPSAMVLGNGLGTPMAYVAVGLILALFGVGYVAMSRQVTNAGALYAYVGRGLGLRIGIGAATVALWAYNTVQVAVYGFFGVVMSAQLNTWFGITVTWWVCAFALLALIQVFGWLNIEIGSKVLGVLMACEWTIMLLMAFSILFKGGAGDGYAVTKVFNPSVIMAGAPGVALVFAFASMFGFESSALYGEEVRDPKRSIPRATYLSLFLITSFFFFTSWMLIVGYGPSNAVDAAGAALGGGNPAAYVFDAGQTYLGSWAPDLMSVFVLTSMFACNQAFHNGIARYLYTLGRDRVLPEALSHTRANGAPHVASVTQSLIALVLILPVVILGKDPVTTLFFGGSGIAVIGIMVLYILASVAAFVFFRHHQDEDHRVWNTRVAPILSALVLTAALVLILTKFSILTGTSTAVANLLALTVVVAFLVGLGLWAMARNRLSEDALADLEAELT